MKLDWWREVTASHSTSGSAGQERKVLLLSACHKTKNPVKWQGFIRLLGQTVSNPVIASLVSFNDTLKMSVFSFLLVFLSLDGFSFVLI